MTTVAEKVETYRLVLADAFRGLGESARDMGNAIHPVPYGSADLVRPPRPRFILICPTLLWPGVGVQGGLVRYDVCENTAGLCYHLWLCADVQAAVGYVLDVTLSRPKLVYRAMRRIQAAREWCLHRRDGVGRELEEIFRQQRGYDRLLVRQAHFIELGGSAGGPAT